MEMSNVFLTGLTNEHRARLAEANVPCYDLVIGEEYGLMIEQKHLEAALAALNAYVESHQATTIEGISKAVLKTKVPGQPTKNHKVTNNWRGGEHDEMHEAARQLLMPLVDREVILHHNSGHICEPVKDGKFHIHFWCSPKAFVSPGVAIPATIWGIPCSQRTAGYGPSGRGAVIVDEASNYPVAELIDNNLYIHMNMLEKVDANRNRIFRVLMEKVAHHIGMSTDEHRALMRRRFIEECTKATVRAVRDSAGNGQVQELPDALHNNANNLQTGLYSNSRFDGANGLQPGEKRTSISVIGIAGGAVDQVKLQARKANVQSLRKRIAHAVAEARDKERKLLTDENVNLDEFGIEYENLMKVKYVKDVKVEGSAIVIYTDILNCKDERTGRLHEIGAFRISLPFTGVMPNWKNLTRTVNGMKAGQHAPHVWPDGSACLGNTADIFPKLFAQRQWSIAAQLAIEFVQAANTSDSAGKHISSWPLARR